ncbi:hypothetical protein [Hankyongella ginsenosidimutans]|uniref:hypothetical protein n=1 Tax=Hankyongella ginsenosidimutans TaxID=1763828 RepID=UPI001FE91377|nr:hypothetical protein [Hankyongella ginsenosidimutans]
MNAAIVGGDQIDRLVAVIAVDFIAAADDRNIPAQQIDEQGLAVLEHRGGARIGKRAPFDNMDHGSSSRSN